MLHQLVVPLVVGFAAGAALRPVVAALIVPVGHPICAAGPVHPRSLYGLLLTTGRDHSGHWGVPCLLEVTTAAAFAAVAAGGASGWYAVAQYWIAFLGAGLLLIDSAVQRLPNVLTLHAGAGTLVLLTAAAAAGEHGSLSRAVAVAAAAGALFTAAALGGMGLGDAKLAVSLGALLGWHSWQAALVALVTSYFLGAVVAIVLLVTGRQHRKSHLAFGPFLIIGTLATLVTST
ncbi:A24 family peptidase [Streptomyces lydicus]|uniref:A24 family peptidase n=1 Tax=Streptomyces lydicus TaxID=47763 RepID=UPI003430E6DE